MQRPSGGHVVTDEELQDYFKEIYADDELLKTALAYEGQMALQLFCAIAIDDYAAGLLPTEIGVSDYSRRLESWIGKYYYKEHVHQMRSVATKEAPRREAHAPLRADYRKAPLWRERYYQMKLDYEDAGLMETDYLLPVHNYMFNDKQEMIMKTTQKMRG